ncbi:MAG: hypothetical protein KKF27_21585 [Gammaproteobacteria bacterium]|nr:hypothetical protein [Gammaproteobacteria bacterium]MBU2685842.1 hypothetical protein [Gammaproteobacteria bacterium]
MYQELADKDKGTAEVIDEIQAEKPKEVEKSDDTEIKMTKTQLQELIDERLKVKDEEIARMKKEKQSLSLSGESWEEIDPMQKRKKFADMKLYRETSDDELGLIINWKHLKDEWNEKVRDYDQIYKITCIYPDGSTKEFEMPYLKFGTIHDVEKVEIIEEDVKKLRKVYGKVRKAYRDKSGYTYSKPFNELDVEDKPGSDWVDLEEIRDHVMVTIKRANGQEIRLEGSKLNG